MAEDDDFDCSSFPFELTETDIENLRLGDKHFKPHDWEEVKHIIGSTVYLFCFLFRLLTRLFP